MVWKLLPRSRTGLLAAALLLGGAVAPATPPKRIVSLNLCADQYLIALADPAQIAALTRFARDPEMSVEVERARRLPIGRGTTEEVIALQPDLIVAAPGRATRLSAWLDTKHTRVLELSEATNYPAIVAQVREVAAAVGHAERGEALIKAMDAAMARLPAPRPRGVAAYYQRRGYLTGTGTLIDDLMRRAGLANLATRLGRPALSQLSIEQMVAARPDYLVVESGSDRVADEGVAMLHHPALAAIPRLKLPQAWTVCGGPAYVQAAASLARQLEAHRPR